MTTEEDKDMDLNEINQRIEHLPSTMLEAKMLKVPCAKLI